MKQKFNKERTITVEYYGQINYLTEGLKIIEEHLGRAVISVDTEMITISKAYFTDKIDILDLVLILFQQMMLYLDFIRSIRYEGLFIIF